MRAQIKDITLAYDVNGNGKGRPILFLHGYPLNRKSWRPQVELLIDAGLVIAPDQRGHGESDAPAVPYSIDRLADDAAALLDELGLSQPAVVVGLSMGGYVALAFYRRHMDRVAGLVLASTRAGADSDVGKANRDKSIALAKEKGVDAIVEAMLPKMLAPESYQTRPGLVDDVRHIMASTPLNGVVGDLGAMRDRQDSTELLGGILKPVLVIHGQEDQLIPPSEAEAAFARLPNARLALVPGAGHLVNLEQPEAFNAEVRIFLRTVE